MINIRRLTKEEKMKLIVELKQSGWNGCICDDCLTMVAEKILEYQLRQSK
jgi:hypothetical protein